MRMMWASVVSPAGLVHSTSSAPSPLIVPAKTVSPGAFVTGTLSPVIGAWLTSLVPVVTRPSSGIRLARLDDEDGADGDLARRHFPLAAIGSAETGRRGSQRHQRGDGPARPAHAPGLEGERDGEEEGDGRRLEPLADRDRADHGDRHQQVHVRAEAPCREPCLRAGCATRPERMREGVQDPGPEGAHRARDPSPPSRAPPARPPRPTRATPARPEPKFR